MNIKFLTVLTLSPALYSGCSTQKMFWEENSTPMNMTNCGRRNFRKNREIKNGEQYVILEISSKTDYLDNSEVTSSESKGYMGIPGKGLTNSLALRTKSPKKKQKARFAITGITEQYFWGFLKKFYNSCYLDCKSKQARNEPTEAYLFLHTCTHTCR